MYISIRTSNSILGFYIFFIMFSKECLFYLIVPRQTFKVVEMAKNFQRRIHSKYTPPPATKNGGTAVFEIVIDNFKCYPVKKKRKKF